ncbi:MAG TPA: ammonium transporter [Oculatellaceae cyanobacterium]
MNSGDTAWVLISSSLVMLMTPALGLFYGGMVQQKNVLTTFMLSFCTLLIVTLQWILFGYSLSFSPDIGHVIGGLTWAGLSNFPATSEYAPTIPHMAYMLFQMKFAIITPALITGAFAERVKFSSYLLFTILWSTLIYDPVAHWVWGAGGWLHNCGAIDFAGGTVVHITAGVAALAMSIALRRRKKAVDHRLQPYSVPLVLFGAVFLWFGWFGFNGGSALAANGLAVQALVTTNVAAAAAALMWMALSALEGRPSIIGVATGAVVGLVAITPACGYVDVLSAMVIGALGAAVSYGCIKLCTKFKIDDALDVCSCHGMAGTFGALATGLFASKAVNPAGVDGLFRGNPQLFLAQLLAVGSVWAFTFVGTYLITRLVDKWLGFTVSRKAQEIGLDISHKWDEFETQTEAETPKSLVQA